MWWNGNNTDYFACLQRLLDGSINGYCKHRYIVQLIEKTREYSAFENWKILLSKAVVSVALSVFDSSKWTKKDLPCQMRFRLVSKFWLCFIGEGRFFYPVWSRVPVSTKLWRESSTCDSWVLGYSKYMSGIIFVSLWHEVWLVYYVRTLFFWFWRYSCYCLVESMGRCSSI